MILLELIYYIEKLRSSKWVAILLVSFTRLESVSTSTQISQKITLNEILYRRLALLLLNHTSALNTIYVMSKWLLFVFHMLHLWITHHRLTIIHILHLLLAQDITSCVPRVPLKLTLYYAFFSVIFLSFWCF